MNDRNPAYIDAPVLALDTETKDPLLTVKGPGCYRKDGYILGVSLYAPECGSTYLELEHPDTSEEERKKNLEFLRKVISAPHKEVVGANLMYDLDWLQNTFDLDGKPLLYTGQCRDIQWAEPLLDEYRHSYSVNALAKNYGLELKRYEKPNEFAWSNGLSKSLQEDVRKYLWQMPASVVDEYAAYDAEVTYNIHKLQEPLLEEQELSSLYDLECGLFPVLLHMRRVGVRLDMRALKKTALFVADKAYEYLGKIHELTWEGFNPSSSAQIAEYLTKKGLPFARRPPTDLQRARGKALGNPILGADALKELAGLDPLPDVILKYKHYNTLITTFLLPYLELQHEGRLHCQFHPLRSDNYGTVSGRFSSSSPNLQQVPGRAEEASEDNDPFGGKIIRKLFIPEEGYDWASADESQEEYRLIAHYASGPGAAAFRNEYINNEDMDIHGYIMERTGFDRTTAKRLNFGGAYGMGWRTCSEKFHWDPEEAQLFMDAYHQHVPFLKPTRKAVISKAVQRGYIKTLLGRRARIHPSRKETSMFNRLIQGSAGDIMKKAMVDCYKAGLFDVLVPHITVHDEMNVSVPRTPEGKEALDEMVNIMRTCVQLRVPLKVDCVVAGNWGDAH